MGKHLACIQVLLESAFYAYGKLVARHPLPFLIVPFLITCLAAIGLIYLPNIMVDDPEYLYTPTNGPAKGERDTFRRIFKENNSYLFLPTRKNNLDGFLQIIITGKNDSNLFNSYYMEKIIELDRNITQTKFNKTRYLDVCASWKGSCIDNVIFRIINRTAKMIDTTPISYPTHNGVYFIASQFGGVSLDKNDYIISAKAVLLSYFVRYRTAHDQILSDDWTSKIKEYLLTFDDSDIMVDFQTYLSNEEELGKSLEGILPRFGLTYIILMSFCAFSCAMTDWVRTKIWVAMAGQLSAGMAILTTLGLLCAIGVPFATSVGVMPFLIIGIGIDDMFVLLSAWRHTSYTLPVEERMGQTMKTAAISITVTSLTDALAFGVGSFSVFRIVTFFCAYTGVAVIFSYIYAITFLVACFALSGRREHMNKHEMTCQQVLPTDRAEHRSKIYQVFCTGGYIDENETGKAKTERFAFPAVTNIINNYIAPFIVKKPVKITIIILYVLYIIIAIWGCFTLKVGLKLQYLAPSSSYLRPFYDHHEKYFTSEYGYRVMIAFTDEKINYCDEATIEDINNQLDMFRNSTYYYKNQSYTESWLSTYTTYLNSTNQKPADMTEFISILKTQFFKYPPYDIFELDVAFNKNFTQITSSRFLLQSVGFQDSSYGEPLMTASRNIAKRSKYNITVYHPEFIFYDPYTVILSNTLQNLALAVLSMLIISILLLPSLISSLFVTLSVVSICTGVIGYMAFWDVTLDTVSMINLIMCVGFSVDFSAHISYHIAISKADCGDKKAKEALGHIGTPVIQGALSTILGVLVLATSESYLFLCFFKVMFLVMFLGVLHALLFLPVFLSYVLPAYCCRSSTTYELKRLEQQNKMAFSKGYEHHQLNGHVIS